MNQIRVLFLTLFAVSALLLTGCAQTTTPTDEPTADVASSTTVSTAESLTGTGGDDNSCAVHQIGYHSIESALIKYVGQEKVDAFSELYDGSEDFNIITFVNYCDLTREDIIQAFGWENKLDQPADGHAYANWYDKTAPYTCGEFLDAIFGDDATLTERIFSAEMVE